MWLGWSAPSTGNCEVDWSHLDIWEECSHPQLQLIVQQSVTVLDFLCSVAFSYSLFNFKIDATDLGRIDAKGPVALALPWREKRKLNKIDGSDFVNNINLHT